jgi:hypothetical protein
MRNFPPEVARKQGVINLVFNSELNTVVARHQIRAGTYAVFRSHHERNYAGTVFAAGGIRAAGIPSLLFKRSLGLILEISRAPDDDPTLIERIK